MLHKVIVHLTGVGLINSKSCGNLFVSPSFGCSKMAFGVKKDGVKWPTLLLAALVHLARLSCLP